jgi:hypothetical protein
MTVLWGDMIHSEALALSHLAPPPLPNPAPQPKLSPHSVVNILAVNAVNFALLAKKLSSETFFLSLRQIDKLLERNSHPCERQ